MVFWLVVWNMAFIFHFIYGIILAFDLYFSRWLKPPTSWETLQMVQSCVVCPGHVVHFALNCPASWEIPLTSQSEGTTDLVAQSLVNQRGPKKARDMTLLKALGLEVPSGRLLRIHGDLLRQQPRVQWQHGRRIAPAAQGAAAAPAPDQPDQADQPMVNRLEDHGAGPPEVEPIDDGAENDQLPLLDDGQGCQSPTKKHGEAMKDSEPSGDSGPSEEKAN